MDGSGVGTELWLWGYAAVLGLLMGSFLNVVIYRLPRMLGAEEAADVVTESALPGAGQPLNLWRPRSHCPQCNTPLGVWELLPVVSYLWQRGRCRHCGAAIAWRYPLVELAAMGLAWLAVLRLENFGWPMLLAGMGFLWALLALAVIDAQTLWLPDRLTLPLLWVGLLVNTQALFADLSSAVWGAALGYSSLAVLAWGFRRTTGREGLGGGDAKLLAALGAWLGVAALPALVLLASLSALIFVGVAIRLGRGTRQTAWPFGPYLAVAGAVLLLWGDFFLGGGWMP